MDGEHGGDDDVAVGDAGKLATMLLHELMLECTGRTAAPDGEEPLGTSLESASHAEAGYGRSAMNGTCCQYEGSCWCGHTKRRRGPERVMIHQRRMLTGQNYRIEELLRLTDHHTRNDLHLDHHTGYYERAQRRNRSPVVPCYRVASLHLGGAGGGKT